MIFQYFYGDIEHLFFTIDFERFKCANMVNFIYNLISWIITNMKTRKLTLKENLSETKLVNMIIVYFFLEF